MLSVIAPTQPVGVVAHRCYAGGFSLTASTPSLINFFFFIGQHVLRRPVAAMLRLPHALAAQSLLQGPGAFPPRRQPYEEVTLMPCLSQSIEHAWNAFLKPYLIPCSGGKIFIAFEHVLWKRTFGPVRLAAGFKLHRY